MSQRPVSRDSDYYEESFESESLHRAPSMEDEITEEINSIAVLNAKDDGVAQVVAEVAGLDELAKPATPSDTFTPEDPPEEPEDESDYANDFFCEETVSNTSPTDFAALPMTPTKDPRAIFPTPPPSDTSVTPQHTPRNAQKRREAELQKSKERYHHYKLKSVISEVDQSMQELPRDEGGPLVPKFNDICSPRGLFTGQVSPKPSPEKLPIIPPKMKFTTAYDPKSGFFGVDLKGERLSKLENYILQRNNRRNNDLFDILVAREHLQRAKPRKYAEGTLLHEKKRNEQLIHRDEFNAWSEAMKRVRSTQMEVDKREMCHHSSAIPKSNRSRSSVSKKKRRTNQRNSSNSHRHKSEHRIDHVSFAAQPPSAAITTTVNKPKRIKTPLPPLQVSTPPTPASRSHITERSDRQSAPSHHDEPFNSKAPVQKIKKPTPPTGAKKPTYKRPHRQPEKPKALPIIATKPAAKPKRPVEPRPQHKRVLQPFVSPRNKPVASVALAADKKPQRDQKRTARVTKQANLDIGEQEAQEIERKIASLKKKIVHGDTKTKPAMEASHSGMLSEGALLSDASSVFPHMASNSTLDSLAFTHTYGDAEMTSSVEAASVMPVIVEQLSTGIAMDAYEDDEFESLQEEEEVCEKAIKIEDGVKDLYDSQDNEYEAENTKIEDGVKDLYDSQDNEYEAGDGKAEEGVRDLYDSSHDDYYEAEFEPDDIDAVAKRDEINPAVDSGDQHTDQYDKPPHEEIDKMEILQDAMRDSDSDASNDCVDIYGGIAAPAGVLPQASNKSLSDVYDESFEELPEQPDKQLELDDVLPDDEVEYGDYEQSYSNDFD